MRKIGKCNKCGEVKLLLSRRVHVCVDCERERRTKLEAYQRHKALVEYSFTGDTPQCHCCGETIEQFLTFDHAQSKSRHLYDEPANKQQMSSIRLVRWLLKEHRNGMLVACFNCNLGREKNNDICPHKTLLLSKGLVA